MLEFPAVRKRKGDNHGKRLLDGLIIVGGETRIAKAKDVEIEGQDIIVVQTKRGRLHSRLGMNLLGQAFFSRELMKRFNPRSIRSVAICTGSDDILGPIAEKFGIEVIVYDPRP